MTPEMIEMTLTDLLSYSAKVLSTNLPCGAPSSRSEIRLSTEISFKLL